MKFGIKIKLITLTALGLMVVTTGFQCKFLTPAQKELLEPIELSWWGVQDDRGDFDTIIRNYRAIHPNITINYRKLREDEFEKELLDALAEDRGPDIFTIQNTWVTSYVPKIEPLPPKTTLAYEITQKSLGVKQETLIEVRDTVSITPRQLQETFVDVVYEDVVREEKIYGLPLSVDTLALFYNRDLFNEAGIPLPPKDWLELQEGVSLLTFQNNDGGLVQSAVAMGTAENVKHSTDILALLMLQNGAEITSGNRAVFNQIPRGFADRTYNPGIVAITFYTDFANPGKEAYTWNNSLSNSLDAFAEGRVAMMFGYHSQVEELEAKRQGKLNYALAAMPQLEGRPEVNIANYWVFTVSKKSQHINEAWDFIQFMTRQENQAKDYLGKTKKPTALRSLIEAQLNDDEIKVFAEQLLTAKNWYKGNNFAAAADAFSEMIEAVNNGVSLQDATTLAVQKIQQTLNP